MSERFNEPSFEVKVSVHHHLTGIKMCDFTIQQSVKRTKAGWIRATHAVLDEVERMHAIDGNIYVCLCPDWHSWRFGCGGVVRTELGG